MDKATDVTRQESLESGTRAEGRGLSSSNPPLDALRSEIDKVREETLDTINTLEQRLSFANLMEQAKEKVRQVTRGKADTMARHTEETSRRVGNAFMDTIKQYPLPLAMVGGGLAWLIASSMRQNDEDEEDWERRYYERRKIDTVDASGTYGLGFLDRRGTETEDRRTREAQSAARQKADQAREKAAELGGRLRDKASQTGQQVRQKVQEVSDSAAEYGRQAQERVVHTGQRTKEGFFRSLERNPLAVAGVVLTAGAILGLVIPESRYEDEQLGPVRDKALDRAREAGRETVQKVESVVREATDSAKDEAEAQGLVGRDKLDKAEEKAKSAVEKTADKVKEKAEAWRDKSQTDRHDGRLPGR